MSKDSPYVLISIVNWNGRSDTEECLRSLFENTEYENFEVLVVDNGSTDGSVSMIQSEFPEVSVIENDYNRGFGKAHNQAFAHARAGSFDYVLLLNNDIVVTDGQWLDILVDVGETEEEIGVVGCRVEEPDGRIHYDGRYFPLHDRVYPFHKEKYEYNRHNDGADLDGYRYVDDVVGAVYLIKRTVLDTVGDLDEAYSPAYGEESDYSVRVWDAGFKVGYTPETALEHKREQTGVKLGDLYLAHLRQRHHAQFMLVNYPLTWVLLGLPFIFGAPKIYLDSDEGGLHLRPQVRSCPFYVLKYVFLTQLFLLKRVPYVVRKRLGRSDIKALVK